MILKLSEYILSDKKIIVRNRHQKKKPSLVTQNLFGQYFGDFGGS